MTGTLAVGTTDVVPTDRGNSRANSAAVVASDANPWADERERVVAQVQLNRVADERERVVVIRLQLNTVADERERVVVIRLQLNTVADERERIANLA